MYDPRMPSISGIIGKHYRTMTKDPHLAEVFPLPPLVAYKRPQNIRDKLIGSKVPPPQPSRPKRDMPGMSKCNPCPICRYINTDKTVKSTSTNAVIQINKPVNCQTRNVIYCISCNKCPKQYIEEDRSLQSRFSEHRGYVVNRHLQKATGYHFNLPGHSVANMEVSIVEKIFSSDAQFRKTREKMYIQTFNTKHKGLNRN